MGGTDAFTYPGTVTLTNGNKMVGMASIPNVNSKAISFTDTQNNNQVTLQSADIERIEVSYDGVSSPPVIFRYMPTKGMFGRISNYWVACLAEGTHLSTYVGAENYRINADGSISLGGTRQVVNHGNSTMIVNPSFPVYMIKEGETALTQVAVTKGVSFEGSAFRSGISRFLLDDPKLGEHIRHQKWTIDNIQAITRNYNPNRGHNALVIDGETIPPHKRSLITEVFDNEMIFYGEVAIPSEKYYGTQFGIGIRTSKYKFLTYGGDIGYASAKYIDEVKRIENHPGNWVDAPVEDRDFSKTSLFRFNASVGAQLPLDLQKVCLIPAAHFSFGATLGNNYSTLYYGPMATLDVGFKLRRGDIFLIGAGYRHNISLKSNDDKEEASAPGFKAYEPYNNLVLRIAYKF